MVGLEPNMLTGELNVRPRLLDGISELRLSGVPLGGRGIDIAVSADDVLVTGLPEGMKLKVHRS